MRREVQLRGRARARLDRASTGARGVACLSVYGVAVGLVACVDYDGSDVRAEASAQLRAVVVLLTHSSLAGNGLSEVVSTSLHFSEE